MKKKMMYGGKVKKMAQGGTTARQEQLNERGIFGDAKAYMALNPTQQKMKKQIDKLQSSLMMQDSTPSNPKHSAADVKRIRKEIKDKKAGLDAGFKSYAKDRLKFRKSTTGGKKAEKFIGKTPDPDKLKVGGKVKKKMAMGGMTKKDVPMDKKKSLGKLPEEVRNKMGFKKAGGKVKKYFEGGKTLPGVVDKNADSYKEGKTLPGVKKGASKGRTPPNKKGRKMMPKEKIPSIKGPKRPRLTREEIRAKRGLMGGGMAMKYKHGGMTKKCPRDGIARKGKTRA